jgi:ATP:corrinoid adenosyltransferase
MDRASSRARATTLDEDLSESSGDDAVEDDDFEPITDDVLQAYTTPGKNKLTAALGGSHSSRKKSKGTMFGMNETTNEAHLLLLHAKEKVTNATFAKMMEDREAEKELKKVEVQRCTVTLEREIISRDREKLKSQEELVATATRIVSEHPNWNRDFIVLLFPQVEPVIDAILEMQHKG